MAKKNKRPNLPQQTLARARQELSGDDSSASNNVPNTQSRAAARATVSPHAAPTRAVSVDDLREEYSYVITDLVSMGILAGILFAALLTASFVLL